jgi:hypothetical protein
MNIGEPREIVEVELSEFDAPPTERPQETPRYIEAPAEAPELVPAA